MRILGRNNLICLHERNEMVDKWLNAWIHELVVAQWRSAADVLEQFPKAQELGAGLFLFQIDPKGYCIKVQISFSHGIVQITDLTELIEDSNG